MPAQKMELPTRIRKRFGFSGNNYLFSGTILSSVSEQAKRKLGVSKMKKTATERLIEADDHSYPVRFKSSREKNEIFVTPEAAAAYLR